MVNASWWDVSSLLRSLPSCLLQAELGESAEGNNYECLVGARTIVTSLVVATYRLLTRFVKVVTLKLGLG